MVSHFLYALIFTETFTADLATSRLQVIFTNMLLRRKKDSVSAGRRLCFYANIFFSRCWTESG